MLHRPRGPFAERRGAGGPPRQPGRSPGPRGTLVQPIGSGRGSTPQGVEYAYDTNTSSRLRTVTDREGNVTTYGYKPAPTKEGAPASA